MSADAMHVVTSADAGFVRPLGVLLRSLAAHHRDSRPTVYVIADSIPRADRGRLSSLIDVEWVAAPPDLGRGVHLPAYLTLPTLFKLVLPLVLPTSVTRAIYLDADVMVRRNLSPLWQSDIGNALLAAVRDPVIPWFGAPLGPPWEELGIQADTPYFNSGVFVANLPAWREQRVAERALDLLRAHSLPNGDQCALNAMARGDWQRLLPKWNVQAGHLKSRKGLAWVAEPNHELAAAVSDPAIVHFNHSSLGRPWLWGCRHPHAAEWFALLDATPWRGWRPRRLGLAARVARQARRAATAITRRR